MFKNVGKSLKILAKINFVCGLVGVVGVFFVLMEMYYENAFAVLFGVGCFIGFIIIESMFIYGFGELIENSTLIAKVIAPNEFSVSFEKETVVAKDTYNFILSNDESYYIINKNEVTYDKNIIIPNEFNSLPVTEIGNYMFYNHSLESITIPNTIKRIGIEAFACCRDLKHINFNGTRAEWLLIEKGMDWDKYSSEYTIHCIDD